MWFECLRSGPCVLLQYGGRNLELVTGGGIHLIKFKRFRRGYPNFGLALARPDSDERRGQRKPPRVIVSMMR